MMVNHVGLTGVLLEFAVIVSLFFLRNDLARAVSLLWFATILPPTALWFPESDDGYCPCFGTLPEILGLSPGFASFIAGSLLIIFLELKQKLKFSPISKIAGRETVAPDYFFLTLPAVGERRSRFIGAGAGFGVALKIAVRWVMRRHWTGIFLTGWTRDDFAL